MYMCNDDWNIGYRWWSKKILSLVGPTFYKKLPLILGGDPQEGPRNIRHCGVQWKDSLVTLKGKKPFAPYSGFTSGTPVFTH